MMRADVNLNRSIAALRLGRGDAALEAARRALALLAEDRTSPRAKRAKAHYREGAALASLGRTHDAIASYRRGLRLRPNDAGLATALRDQASHALTAEWLATHLAGLVVAAARPGLLSSRDGKVLRPAIDRARMDAADLAACARDALLGREAEFRAHVCDAWIRGADPATDRALLYAVRALCHLARLPATTNPVSDEGAAGAPAGVGSDGREALHADDLSQALRDARASVAYAPPEDRMVSCRAHLCLASALDRSGDAINASIEALRAHELLSLSVTGRKEEGKEEEEKEQGEGGDGREGDGGDGEGDGRAHALRLEAEAAWASLRERLSPPQQAAACEGGSSALASWLEDWEEMQKPEFMRKRPKYYYYYEWMKARLNERFPEGLPPPVMDKLLASDADELDLLLQYPQAIQGQVDEYEHVLRLQVRPIHPLLSLPPLLSLSSFH